MKPIYAYALKDGEVISHTFEKYTENRDYYHYEDKNEDDRFICLVEDLDSGRVVQSHNEFFGGDTLVFTELKTNDEIRHLFVRDMKRTITVMKRTYENNVEHICRKIAMLEGWVD